MPFTNHHNHGIKCKTVNWNSCMASPIITKSCGVCELNWKCQQCKCVCVVVVAFIEINWLKIESILRIEKRHDMCYSWANTYHAYRFYFSLYFSFPFTLFCVLRPRLFFPNLLLCFNFNESVWSQCGVRMYFRVCMSVCVSECSSAHLCVAIHLRFISSLKQHQKS